MTKFIPALLPLLLFLSFIDTTPLQAHGRIHQQIVEVTKQIEADPTNSELYLKRGRLRIDHRDFDRALADLDKASELTPPIVTIDHERARALNYLERPEDALKVLDAYLQRLGENADTLGARSRGETLYGEVLEGMGKAQDAATAHLRALKYAAKPLPEHFLNPVRAWRGDDFSKNAEQALQLLDRGIEELGSLVTLELPALEAEALLGNLDAAFARLDRLIASTPRPERWYYERGRLLAEAGQTTEARTAFEKALAGLDEIPAIRRQTPAMKELEQSLEKALADLPKS